MALGNQKIVNPFKPLVRQLPKPFQNRYTLVLIVFVLWLALFDQADVWTQIKLQRTVRRLELDKVYYQQKLKEVQQQKADMENNKEKFAREHYYMKVADEDVFVIQKKD